MFQTGQIAQRPQGMNAGNNMAFLQQAQGGRGGFNPFAPATASRPSMPQNFGASMYATPAQRSPMPLGGQFGQQDMGTILQQFAQPYGGAMGGMFGGMGPAPFQRNQQQMEAQMKRQGPQNMAVAQPMSLEQGRRAYAQQQQAMFNPSAADQQRRQMAAGQMAQNAQLEAAHRAASPQTIGLMSQAQQMGLDPYAVLMNPSGFQQQYGAQQQAMSQGATGGGMTMGGGPRGAGMTQSPQGMNAQNNIAFLQQARASRPAGFNPFAR